MRQLQERAERAGREAVGRRIDELAERIVAKLPRAEIEKMTSAISVGDLRLLNRWLDDPELRFISRSGR